MKLTEASLWYTYCDTFYFVFISLSFFFSFIFLKVYSALKREKVSKTNCMWIFFKITYNPQSCQGFENIGNKVGIRKQNFLMHFLSNYLLNDSHLFEMICMSWNLPKLDSFVNGITYLSLGLPAFNRSLIPWYCGHEYMLSLKSLKVTFLWKSSNSTKFISL